MWSGKKKRKKTEREGEKGRIYWIETAETYLVAGKIDTHGPLLEQMDRKLVFLARHARDDDIAQRGTVLDGPVRGHVDHLVLALADPLATRELLHARHIDAVHACAVVGQQRRQRPADHLAPIDDADRAPEQPVPVGQDRVVDVEVLEDLDHREGRAGQDGFEERVWVQEPDVLVHVEDVPVAEALDVLAQRDDVLQVLVLAGIVDRVVHDHAVVGGVGVGGHDGLLDAVLGYLL